MKKLFKNMRLVDVENEEIIEDAVFTVEDDKFNFVGNSEKDVDDFDEVVNFGGKTVIPGLIDAHIHSLFDASGDPFGSLEAESASMITLKAANFMEKTLEAGIVAIRDMGGVDYLEMGLNEAIKSGLSKGPRMQLSGKLITMTGGHGHQFGREVDSPHEARKAAREQLKNGVDLIKIMATGGVMTEGVQPGAPQLTEEEMRAAIIEAHKAERKTATHAQGVEGIKNALRAGIDSIEHGIFLDDEAIELMVHNDVFLVPTLAAPYWIIDAGVEKGVPEFAVEKSKAVIESHAKSFQKAREAGVKIAMGTDAGTPFNKHGKNKFEIKMMVENGMKPIEAIKAATMGGAELMELTDKLGSISEGKLADMVVVDGKPDQDIEDIYEVAEVYKEGKKVK
ncbi:MAG TPA: amidohydrolase family protein [Halanaerobiales bacterium]|nr:amidohydrolase family protein [Halanaerobiales bacterium]